MKMMRVVLLPIHFNLDVTFSDNADTSDCIKSVITTILNT